MNNKQKTIITIYIIVAILAFIYAIYTYFAVSGGGWVIINGQQVALNSIPNGYAKTFWGLMLFYVIGLVILWIPTYFLNKVWRDKKTKGN